jgi:hypothetical protein
LGSIIVTTLIHNVTELQDMSSDLAGDYELANDIDCTGFVWTPIHGTFTGSLDGKTYLITNLSKTTALVTDNMGLMFEVNDGNIQNIHLVNCTAHFYNLATGQKFVGGICGENDGTIIACYTTGSISTAKNGINGGVCGINYGTISRCYSSANVGGGGATVGRVSTVGGLVGCNLGTINNCYARGHITTSNGLRNYAGGLVGQNGPGTGTISHSYSTGAVTDGVLLPLGTIMGFTAWDLIPSGANCFWDTITSGLSGSAGLETGKTTAEMKTLTTFTSAGWDFTTIWAISPSYNDGYPNLEGIGWLPTVTTGAATGITDSDAVLNGQLVDDGGLPCQVQFEWGYDTSYGNTTPLVSAGIGPFSAPLAGLTRYTIYHYRAVAINAHGTSYGADVEFDTLIGPPTVETDAASNLLMTSANLNGTLSDDGGDIACQARFNYGTTTALGTTTPWQPVLIRQAFSESLTFLIPGTIYYFRAESQNSVGSGNGSILSIQTAGLPNRAYSISRRKL